MPWFYYVCRFLINILIRVLTRWQVKGKENVPQEGSLLVVANHLHAYDPAVLGISLGRKVIFMAKEELFRFRLRAYLLSGLGSFPVRRGRLDRQAIRQSEKVLANGLALAMFPEGSRSESTQLQSALRGSALIASRSGAPILPAAIIGTERLKGLGWVSRPRITVNFGKPFYLPKSGARVTKEELLEHTDFAMQRIAELLPLEYRGVYGGGRKTRRHED
jgi:1-acyl-sn-glycerol-3-phosphate acyltransferase